MTPTQSKNAPVWACKPLTLFVLLCAVIMGLVFVGAAVEWLDYRFDAPFLTMLDRMFDLDRESNVPTWVSSSLLLVASLELFAVSRTGLAHVKAYRRRWVLLGVLFVLMSLDESARLHERLGAIVMGTADESTNPLLRNGWVVVYGLALVPLAALYIRFVLAMPKRTGTLVVAAGLVYVGGALGLELLESLAQGSGERGASVLMFFLTTAQETAEMLGVALMIFAARDYRFTGDQKAVLAVIDRRESTTDRRRTTQPAS
jgi:hypothetical protein